MQTSCREIFQRRVPNTGLLSLPAIAYFQDIWYSFHSQALFSSFFSFFFGCLKEVSS